MSDLKWETCVACHQPMLMSDQHESVSIDTPCHQYCDEPRWQKCSGCGTAVHLNFVEYTGPEMKPWCEDCYEPPEDSE